MTRGNSKRTIIYCEIKKTANVCSANMAMARLASPQGSPACVGSSTADRPASAPGGLRSRRAGCDACDAMQEPEARWDGETDTMQVRMRLRRRLREDCF